MLYWLMNYLAQDIHALRVFQYLTFRSIVAAITALLIALIFSPKLIDKLTRMQIGQSIREDGPESHLKKSGTPTMGGLLIIIAVTISGLLWGDISNHFVLITLFVLLSFGVLGWLDDYRKVVAGNSKGLSAKAKITMQLLLAFSVVGYLYWLGHNPGQTILNVPFFKGLHFQLGVGFLLLGVLVVVGSSNAVNLTDGLDGLALMPTVLVALALAVFAYLSGNVVFSKYLIINYIPGVGELAVLCASIVGAGLGFLWYNTYPAQVFMGDVGSLSLGATLGIIAIMIRQELVLMIMGGVFVAETISVILQVGSYKLRGKRIFKMAPLHHHFELKGWAEPKVIVRFWIVTVVLVLVGLATLKLR